MTADLSLIRDRFGRQARAFAQSPFQRDPERLKRLIRFLDLRPADRVLDVACGPGIVTAALARGGYDAVGIDLTDAMLRQAGTDDGCRYVVGDATRLPFRACGFDRVVCRNSFHHFQDPLSVTRQMAEVVRPGGSVVVEDMRAPDDAARRDYHETVERLRDPAHGRTLTRTEIISILGSAGLVIDQEEPLQPVLDFEEWLERAYPPAEDGARARAMMAACVEEDLIGHAVWREDGRLKFRRRSIMIRALRPA